MSHILLKKYGSGNQAVIAFPGWTHPIENEPTFLSALSKQYTVYSVCLPGYCGAKDARSFLDFPAVVIEVHTALQSIHEPKQVWVGFSMGCRLIMELEKQHPTKHPKVFVGSPVHDYSLPLWAQLALLTPVSIKIIRKIPMSQRYVVDTAIKTISQDPTGRFSNKNVTLAGAFDSLVGLLKSRTRFEAYVRDVMFVYGEYDPYLTDAQKYKLAHLTVVNGSSHNCVRNNETQVVECIDSVFKR